MNSKLSLLRSIRQSALVLLIFTAPTVGLAQTKPWPLDRPIQIHLGQAAGFAPDINTRAMTDELSRELGQSVVVINKPAGGGRPMMQALRSAPADGYTFSNIFWHMMVAWPSLFSNLEFRPSEDLKHVGLYAEGAQVIVTYADSGLRTLADLIARVRSSPQTLQYGTFGVANPGHMYFEFFKSRASIKMEMVPFKGKDAVLALHRKDVPVVIGGVVDFAEDIKAGKLVMLATTGRQRLSSFPNVPTFREQGIDGLEEGIWAGLIAPPGTPDAIIERMQQAIARVVTRPEFRPKLDQAGRTALVMSGGEMQQKVRKDIDEWGKVIRAAGIKVE